MKKYDVKKYCIDGKDFFIVFSTSYISPLKFVKKIEKELAVLCDKEIEVIFDFFLSNISKSERYGKSIFNGSSFVQNSFSIVKVSKKDILRKISAQYYKESKNELDFTLVNSSQKKMIFRGIAI